MKHTRGYVIMVMVLSMVLCSCGEKKKTFDKPQIEEIRTICELATMECYYNNVAKSVKTKGSGFTHWGEKDRTFWIEYSGRAVIGIDMSKVEMKLDETENTVEITMPQAKLLRMEADENTLNEDSYIASEDAYFNKNKITAKDQQKAVKDAQKTMKKKVEGDASLLLRAKERAKKLIQNYVEKLGDAQGVKYQITWRDLEEQVDK